MGLFRQDEMLLCVEAESCSVKVDGSCCMELGCRWRQGREKREKVQGTTSQAERRRDDDDVEGSFSEIYGA